MKILKQRY
jgi:hypothetical protein